MSRKRLLILFLPQYGIKGRKEFFIMHRPGNFQERPVCFWWGWHLSKFFAEYPAACRGDECMPYRRGYKRKWSVPLIHRGACGFSQEPAQQTSCAKDAPWLATGRFTQSTQKNPTYIRLGKDGPQENQKYQDMGSDDPEFVVMIKFVHLLNPLKPAAATS